jgi:homoserine O-acetyltransferase/O-succinyltransferase
LGSFGPLMVGFLYSEADAYLCADSGTNSHWKYIPGSPFIRSVVPIACGAYQSAWQIAIHKLQSDAITSDPRWSMEPSGATEGLIQAWQIALMSYGSPQGYRKRFGRQRSSDGCAFYGEYASWKGNDHLDDQAYKFSECAFDSYTYLKMIEQVDSHDISRNRGGSVADVLKKIEIPTCVIGIDSDILYPLSEQEELAANIPGAKLRIIHSDHGHQGFLLEEEQVAGHIIAFLNANK